MELIRVQDSDYKKTYELFMTFEADENGFLNPVYGYDYDKFLEWIEIKRDWSMGKNLPEYANIDAKRDILMDYIASNDYNKVFESDRFTVYVSGK